jgi:hypothetical protein
MADMTEKAIGHYSGSSDSESLEQAQYIFEQPKGIKGVYGHPLTQVHFVECSGHGFWYSRMSFQQVCMLGFVCFMCPGSVFKGLISTCKHLNQSSRSLQRVERFGWWWPNRHLNGFQF